VETLKSFEKKDSKVAAAAATNLSFLYNLVRISLMSLSCVVTSALLKGFTPVSPNPDWGWALKWLTLKIIFCYN